MKSNVIFAFFLALTLVTPGLTNAQIRKSPAPTPSTTASPGVKNRLEEAKLKRCQAKESSIQKRTTQLTRLVNTITQNFDDKATRVKNYYTTKVIPTGTTLSNYDALVNAIATKKAAVESALAKAQTTATVFKCDGDNPKGQLTQYRTDMQAVKKALQEYRTSIKDLIVAIRTLSKTPSPTSTPSTTTSPTPSPSVTP